MARQIAAFLYGRMAVGGCLTPRQTNSGESIEWIINDLTKGVDEAVAAWTLGQFTDIQEMYNIAEWGKRRFDKRHEQGGAE